MESVTSANELIKIQQNFDYSVRFIIENNFSAVQLKLAKYGIAVNNTLEAYSAVISLIGTNALADVLTVPYLKNATNGTGGYDFESFFSGVTVPVSVDGVLQRNLLDGFNNLILGLTDGDMINATLGGLADITTSAFSGTAGLISSSFSGISGVTSSALLGAGAITAPLLGGIVPTQQNQVPLSRTAETSSSKTGLIIFIAIAVILISVAIYFVTKKKSK